MVRGINKKNKTLRIHNFKELSKILKLLGEEIKVHKIGMLFEERLSKICHEEMIMGFNLDLSSIPDRITKPFAELEIPKLANDGLSGGLSFGLADNITAVNNTLSLIKTIPDRITKPFAELEIPKLASGGIAYGPTLGVFGEYAGVSSNPEVIAPLDKLRNIIGPVNRGTEEIKVTGEFKLKGRDMYVALDRVKKELLRVT